MGAFLYYSRPSLAKCAHCGRSRGTVTAIGQPSGALISQTIGRAGGTIQSSDGRFSVQIPAGALASDVTIGLQPLANTNFAGKGGAYRLTPHGQQFAQPITMTGHYIQKEVEGTLPQALSIAYQNEKGVWMAMGGVALDTTQRTVAIKTTHFSDWSFFEAIHLDPALRVYVDDEHAIFPFDGEYPLTQRGRPFNRKYVDKWNLNGQGYLEADGSAAEYHAPNNIPYKTSPVEVSVRLLFGPKAVGIIIAKIYVAPEGISLAIGSEDWRTIPGGGMIQANGLYMITALADKERALLSWMEAPYGQFSWTPETVTFSYSPDVWPVYQHIYNPVNPHISPGSITVIDGAEYGSPDEVVGHFNLEPAGRIYAPPGQQPQVSTAPILGVFRVRKAF